MAQAFTLPNVDALMAPYKALNELAQANLETLVAMQTKNFTKYSEMALNTAKEASTLTDLEQTQAFAAKQGELSKKTAEELAADFKTVAEMGQAYAAEAQKAITESVKKVA